MNDGCKRILSIQILNNGEESNKLLLDILKGIREFMFETCGQKFREVVQMILDQWKAGIKHFAKEMKDIFLQAMSFENTTECHKSYVSNAFWYATLLVKPASYRLERR